MDPNYPDLIYPHPQTGYDWEPRSGRGTPGLHGPEPAPQMLLTIAQSAQRQKEIWENFVAEARYPGPILDDGKFPIEPAVGAEMLDAFYAGRVQNSGNRADYTLGGIWRLTQLMRVWAAGQMELGDEAAALALLAPAEAVAAPPTKGEIIWQRFRLISILLLLGLLALMYFGIIQI